MSFSDENAIAWSFRPIFVWFRCIGINFMDHHRKVCWLVYGILCFLINLTAEVDILYFLQRPELYNDKRKSENNSDTNITTDDVAEFDSVTSSLNGIIDFTNYATHSLGSHIILLTILRFRWKRLFEIFKRCNSHLNDDEFYARLRRMSLFGVIYVIVHVVHKLYLT